MHQRETNIQGRFNDGHTERIICDVYDRKGISNSSLIHEMLPSIDDLLVPT